LNNHNEKCIQRLLWRRKKKTWDRTSAEWKLNSVSECQEGSVLNGCRGTDMKDMRLKAGAVVNDALFSVNNLLVFKSLHCADFAAFINVEAKERNRHCLELMKQGLGW
jgi:hypothetical protein